MCQALCNVTYSPPTTDCFSGATAPEFVLRFVDLSFPDPLGSPSLDSAAPQIKTVSCSSLYLSHWHGARYPVGTQLMLMNELINE